MSLRFSDSFDHLAAGTGDILFKWTSSVSLSPGVSAGNGRRSTNSLRFAGNSRSLTRTIDAQGTWTVGFAYMTSAFPGAGAFERITAFVDGGTVQCDLQVKSDGTLRITRGGSASLGVTTFALSTGVFYYIEFKVLINSSTGTAEVKVNGSSKLALASQNTQNTGNATANQLEIGPAGIGGMGGNQDYDDLYLNDGQGSVNNSFLGDVRVDALFPTGAGNTTQLTRGGTDSGANWSQVDEAAPNGDTDYVEHATNGNKDTYATGDISHTPISIFGVVVTMHAKKDDAGAKSITGVVRSGTTDFDGSAQALSSSYVYYFDIRETDPNTSAAWTKTNLNAAEIGCKVAA